MNSRVQERDVYKCFSHYWLNQLVFPLKMIIPQPIINKIPWLTTNEDLRVGMVLQAVQGKLLDVGCGANRLVCEYRATGGEGCGVDIYPWIGVDEVVEDTSRLNYPDSSFDAITFVACLNHIPNRSEVLLEAHRLLASEGRLVLTNLTPWVSRIWHAYAFWDRDQHERGMKEGEKWGFNSDEFKEILLTSGFIIDERIRFAWGLNEMWICRKNIV